MSTQPIRQFASGATRDADTDKLDLEGFLSPLVIDRFGEYMHEKRKLPDGSYRDSDNWQLGIPLAQYMKSLLRHVKDAWSAHRGYGTRSGDDIETELCAVLFNAQGYLHELLKAKQDVKAQKDHRRVATPEELAEFRRGFEAKPLFNPDPSYWQSGGLPDKKYSAIASHPMASEALRDEFEKADRETGL